MAVTFREVLPQELEVWRRHRFAALSLIAAAVAAITACLVPTLLLGQDRVLGLSAFARGSLAGAALAWVLGPACLLVIFDVEYRGGMRAVRHLGGISTARLALVQLLVGIMFAVAVDLVTMTATVTATVSDYGFRTLTGDYRSSLPLDWSALGTAGAALAGAVAMTCITWSLCVALRSGLKAALWLVAALSSWVGCVLLLPAGWSRLLLGLHPAALPWLEFSPWATARDVPHALALVSAGVWALLLALFLMRNIATPR